MPPKSDYHQTWMELLEANPCTSISFLPSPYDLDDRNLFDQDDLWADNFENRLMCIEMDVIEAWAKDNKIRLSRVLPVVRSLIGADPIRINGYFDDITVTQGESLSLSLAAGVLTRGLTADGVTLTDTITGEQNVLSNVTAPGFVARESCKRYFRDGCAYSAQWSLPTQDIKPGAYTLTFTDAEDEAISNPLSFFVNAPAPQGKIVSVQIPTFTMQSYNLVGGASLYKHSVADEAYQARLIDSQLYQVSLNRPFSTTLKDYHTYAVFADILPLLTDYGYTISYVDDLDLHKSADSITGTDIWLMIGHHEYWTQSSSTVLKDYLAGGGKILNLSGNNYWWRADYTEQNAISLCRCNPSRNKTTSVRFSSTGRFPDNVEVLGVSFALGGYPPERRKKFMPEFANEEERKAFLSVRVEDAQHPIFKYMDIQDKAYISNSANWLKVEIDGLPLTEDGEIPNDIIGAEDGRYTVFASAHVSQEDGNMINLALGLDAKPTLSGGHVLTFGSVGFYNALKDPYGEGRKMLNAALEYLQD